MQRCKTMRRPALGHLHTFTARHLADFTFDLHIIMTHVQHFLLPCAKSGRSGYQRCDELRCDGPKPFRTGDHRHNRQRQLTRSALALQRKSTVSPTQAPTWRPRSPPTPPPAPASQNAACSGMRPSEIQPEQGEQHEAEKACAAHEQHGDSFRSAFRFRFMRMGLRH